MDKKRLRPSSSVGSALKKLGDQPTCAANVVRAIIDVANHRIEYADRKFTSLNLQDTSEEKPPGEWLNQVDALFDAGLIEEAIPSEQPAIMHGRMTIIGLSLLEQELYNQLAPVNAFDTLVEELVKKLGSSFESVLTEEGRQLYTQISSPDTPPTTSTTPSPTPGLVESTTTLTDDPLINPNDDLLGRSAFARFLVRRLETIAAENPWAYAFHIYAPWGAGKSTVLNFMRFELESSGNWLVVDFNAWRNQHIQPPWWSLMERVYQDTKGKLSSRERFQENWWRFNTGRLDIWVGLILLFGILGLFVFPLLASKAENAVWGLSATAAENLSKIIAIVATIWGGILAVTRSLLLGSAKAAQSYTELTRDPTEEIRTRFNELIKRLAPLKVAIFIDDLDRCQSQYVVDLLEGIQTLFREAPVVFLVAADRQWLNACYEQVYEKIEPKIKEPGKPLGSLFLEKAFRFSTPLPGIPDELKKEYWHYLLQLKSEDGKAELEEERKNARKELEGIQDEAKIRQKAENSSDRSFVERRALLEEASIRLAAPGVQERLEHTLKPYNVLLEPNPRAMKRLANAYSANRALAFLSEIEVNLHQLTLWTILSSRWPILADYLCEHPEMVEKIVPKSKADADADPIQDNADPETNEQSDETKKTEDQKDGIQDEDLKALLRDEDVIDLVTGQTKPPALTEETVRQCARMRA